MKLNLYFLWNRDIKLYFLWNRDIKILRKRFFSDNAEGCTYSYFLGRRIYVLLLSGQGAARRFVLFARRVLEEKPRIAAL